LSSNITPQVVRAVQQAAKYNDLSAAMQLFASARAEGLQLPAHLYNTLLYLCSGGDRWARVGLVAGWMGG
jgi:hypothetical protein